jgi:hypothetical protein
MVLDDESNIPENATAMIVPAAVMIRPVWAIPRLMDSSSE